MHLKSIFPFLTLQTSILCAALPTSNLNSRSGPGNEIPCVAPIAPPPLDQQTCILTYLTDSSSASSIEPIWERVSIYSPACDIRDRNQVTTEGQWPSQAAGLSLKNPLVFGVQTQKVGGKTGETSDYVYEGKRYASDSCGCWMEDLESNTGDICCFGCVPYPLNIFDLRDVRVALESEIEWMV